MKHSTAIKPGLKGWLHTAVLLILIVFITALILPALAACGKQNAAVSDATVVNTEPLQPDETKENTEPSQPAAVNEVWDDLFSYDETESVQFNPKIPTEIYNYTGSSTLNAL